MSVKLGMANVRAGIILRAMFRLATIEIAHAPRVVLAVGETLYAVEPALAAYRRKTGKALLGGVPRPLTMLGLLDRWPAAVRDLARLAAFLPAARGVRGLAAARARFLPPILYPPRVFAAGSNYTAHSKEMTDRLRPGTPYTTRENSNPYVFLQSSVGPLVGHRAAILASRVPDPRIDWEGELVAVVGRKARAVTPAEARACVAGYTIANDISARTLLLPRRLDFKIDWLMCKCPDTFCPMGPYLTPAAFVPEPERLRLRTTVNGEVMQDARTDDLTHGIADMLAFISQAITLLPGDVLMTGTPSGVGFGRDVFLKPGDVVRVEIEGLGALENPVA
jgi:2-keto-4-pentenoate hydratase/2-oxohepta-3-ene-1,7-dioic acid hydratase in catechol pathway